MMNLSAEELLDHSQWLRRFAAALVRNSEDADDLAQDALVALAGSRSKVRDVRGFLAGTVRFLALNRHRGTARRQGLEAEVAREHDHMSPANDDVRERMDMMRVVLEEVRELPPLQARTIGARFFDELSHGEIALREGVTTSTVRSNLTRGLAALRERLDRRLGGRDVWCAVLGPWAVPVPAGLFSGAESPVSAAAPTAPGASFGSALFSAGVMFMSAKVIGAVAAVLALVALWAASDRDPGPERALAVISSVEAVDATDPPEPLEDVSGGGERTSVGTTPSQSTLRPDSATTEVVEALYPLEGRLVDRATGEPLGGMRVRFHRPQDDPSVASHIGDATSQSNGSFRADDAPVPAGPVTVSISDGVDLHASSYGFGPFDLELPFQRDIEVDLGPTIQLHYVTGPFSLTERYGVQARSAGAVHRRSMNETLMRLAPAPWVRFRSPLKGKGPWTLRLASDDGLVVGTGSFELASGVAPDPVPVHFKERGAVEFTQSAPSIGVARGRFVDLFTEAGEALESVRLTVAGGVAVGRVGGLKGGVYAWSCRVGDAVKEGTVEVHSGELTQVRVAPFDGPLATIHVSIDATAVPETDVGEFGFFLFEEANPENSYQPTAKRTEGAADGMWQILVEELPKARWMVAVHAGKGYQVDRTVQPIAEGAAATRVVVTKQATRAVALEVFDTGGTAIVHGVEAVHLNGVNLSHLTYGVNGLLEPVEVPSDSPTVFVARAPGYQMTQVDYDPSRDGSTVRVTLKRGWRGRVFVVEGDALEPISGARVIIDGQEAGRTALDGAFWFEGDGPPSRIDIEIDDPAFDVISHPFELKDTPPLDLVPGYPFIVKRGAGDR